MNLKRLIILSTIMMVFLSCAVKEKPEFIKVENIKILESTSTYVTLTADALFLNPNDIGGELKTGGDFAGRFTPGFKNNTSYQINPFIQYKGLEFFGIYETSKGSKAEGNEKGSFTQVGTELLYRFGEQGQFYIAGRYNSVIGNADFAPGSAKPNEQKITRTNIGAGWFMTKNTLVKLEYVTQEYNDQFGGALNAAKMNGVVLEAVIGF